jgi:predicted transposase YbfD/YdcC
LPDALSRATPCTRKKTFEAAAAANAHLIVQLKDNQPILRNEAEAMCATATPLSRESRVDKNRRNRHETRTVAVFEATQAVTGTEWEPHVAAIIRVERTVFHFLPATGRWKPSCEISFYLSSHPITAKTAATAVRQHWGIENTSHHSRDVTFREDASRIRKNPGVFARLRSFAYNILKRNQTDTTPQDRLAAAFGGLKAMLSMTFSRER